MANKLPEQKWENVSHNSGGYLSRMKVPGGWLVREVMDVMTFNRDEHNTGYEWRSSICFMPDINHEWLKEEKDDFGDEKPEYCGQDLEK